MIQTTDAEALFNLAQEIAAMTHIDEEIRLRSAINRAYYAAFLLAREKTRILTDVDVHAEVIRRTYRRNEVAGKRLRLLREHRVNADYEFPAPEAFADWQKNWKFVMIKTRVLLDQLANW